MRWRRRVWPCLAALMAHAAACRGEQSRTPRWSSDGDAIGQRVRDGRVPGTSHARFRSTILNREVGAVIVTPPGYAARPERRYPTLYVLPGIGGDEWTYLRDIGLEAPATKALFADEDRAPIVVFGNPGDSGGHRHGLNVLAEELVGFVDAHYRTRRDARGRALHGFSLGGATALSLLLQRPDVFGHAAALSSACYLLATCATLRKDLVDKAKLGRNAQVMLAVGEREPAANRAISEELAPLLGTSVEVLPDVDHNWAALLATRELGQRIAAFHSNGFVSPPSSSADPD